MANIFSELFKGKTKKEINTNQFLNAVGGSMDSKFARDIYTNKQRSLHEEMQECKEAYRENALVHTSIDTMSDLILGDGIHIETHNEVLKKFLEDRHLEESGFNDANRNAIKESIITGNGYIEVLLDKNNKIVGYEPVYNSEDIYIDFNYETSTVIRYIQRIYLNNESKNAKNRYKSFTLRTPYGYETIYGIEIPKKNILHFKYGLSTWGVYGRSDIAPILNDLKILEVIERSIAVIAKYKAIPKNALMIEKREGEKPLSPEEVVQMARDISSQSDYESPILNRKLEALNLSASGGEIQLTPYIDYLKRKITISMAPEFLIHGQETNRATSVEQKQMYYLRVNSIRQVYLPKINRLLRVDVLTRNKTLIAPFSVEFGEFDVVLPEQKETNTITRYTSGIITIAEARKMFDLPEIDGTDVFSWEVQSSDMSIPGSEIESISIKKKNEKTGESENKKK